MTVYSARVVLAAHPRIRMGVADMCSRGVTHNLDLSARSRVARAFALVEEGGVPIAPLHTMRWTDFLDALDHRCIVAITGMRPPMVRQLPWLSRCRRRVGGKGIVVYDRVESLGGVTGLLQLYQAGFTRIVEAGREGDVELLARYTRDAAEFTVWRMAEPHLIDLGLSDEHLKVARVFLEEAPQGARVPELAAMLAVSPRQLRRTFNHSGGPRLGVFLRWLRLLGASLLLDRPEMSDTGAVKRFGYPGFHEFGKAYRSLVGTSVSEARSTGFLTHVVRLLPDVL